MEHGRTLITSYIDPDLDGTACAIAYAEFLQKQGKNVQAALFGTPHIEAQFVFRTFNIRAPFNADDQLQDSDSIILVDASHILNISSRIKPTQIIEVIDHRKVHESEKFSNAKVQIELVGSCATVIAEKFFNANASPFRTTAALLYSAIVSNTVNFKADVTTDRDKKMAEWLLTKFKLPVHYVHDMFEAKSTFQGPLKSVLSHDLAEFNYNGKKFAILQLEILGVEKLLAKSKDDLVKAITEFKIEKKLQYIFLTMIDIEKGTNTFLVIDKQSEELVTNALDVSFENNIAVKEGILMRKSIIPLIKDLLLN